MRRRLVRLGLTLFLASNLSLAWQGTMVAVCGFPRLGGCAKVGDSAPEDRVNVSASAACFAA